ncbi:MAG TPA: S9 family peptidase, partial [Porphyromonadaceae bacterium]|nr:S9 family peptidase [Porphyromonadaceae bacterium]
MKNRTIIAAASGVLLCGMAAYAAPRVLDRFNAAPPVRVMTPAMSDSVNTDGKKYDTADLLDNRMTLDFKRLKSTLAQAGDTTGRITLARPAQGYEVILMQTHLRAERFAKGSLKVTSPARFEVLVNGEQKAKKTTAEDSVTSASAQTVQLTLEPERDYTLTLKLLADASAKCNPEVKAEFIPDSGYDSIAIAADPNMKRRFYVDDCVLGTRVMATKVSPDGKYALVK